ncbi:glycosyltransferase family 39 protein [Gordonia aichiensis]|uniref:glycosyltransferase family 39 protein n=1 Tax=Gordonia aichiensis TaxID=36820 RepID=UPI003D766A7B
MRRRSCGAIAVFVAAALGYLLVGAYLTVDRQFFAGDALSRVQSAQAVLFSRDPHLSAIGFIFTPLTAVAELPLAALAPWWPALITQALTAVVMSALFMAGSVTQLAGIARDRGLSPLVGTVVVLAYVLNPMIVFYGANGMSEAPYLFCLLWAVRRLIRWADTDDVHDLVTAGAALGLSYLTRYDGGAAALAATGFVAAVSYRRRPAAADGVDVRRRRAVIDAAVVAIPTATTFLVWAVTSWLITGNLFAQFTSEYGNAAIIAQLGGTGSDTVPAAVAFSAAATAIMAPLLVLLVPTAVLTRRHRLRAVAAGLLVFGAVLAFQVLAYARGTTFGFLRFYLTVIPLSAVLTALIAPAGRLMPYRRLGPGSELPEVPERPRRWARPVTVAAVLALVAGVFTTWAGMASPKYAPQEFALRAVIAPDRQSTAPLQLDARKVARSFSTEREIAAYLDALALPDGAVLCDTVYGFAVVVRSRHPRQFVIPSDQDFARILNNPAAHGVHYLLAVPNEGRGRSDALNVRFPTLYENGAQIAALALEARNQGADLPDWRLYRVIDQE